MISEYAEYLFSGMIVPEPACYAVAMGTLAGLSVAEYLKSSYPKPDPEYREGRLVERTVPDYLHGKTQMLLAMFFGLLRQRLAVFPCTETRMKITEGRFVIPDLAVFWPDEPSRVPDQPPLIAVEVLSPDDKMTEVRRKLEEYRAWGVAHVWLVDPLRRTLEILRLESPD